MYGLPAISMTPRPTSVSTPARASNSVVSAKRLGTGLPSAPRWAAVKLDENPAAPAAMAARTSARMVSISSAVAVRSYASGPSTAMRTAE